MAAAVAARLRETRCQTPRTFVGTCAAPFQSSGSAHPLSSGPAPARYLSTHDIEHYFSDALALLIKLRLQSPPQLKIPAALYFAKYFISG